MNYFKVVFFLLTIILTACSRELLIESVYEKSTSPSQYLTYGWLDERDEDGNTPAYLPDWMDTTIRNSIDGRMQAAGYWLRTEEPDLWVHYHMHLRDTTVPVAQHYEYRYNRFWLGELGRTYQYTEGMLMIDLIDAKTCEVVWRGTAKGPIDDIDAGNAERKMREIVTRIFEQFPGHANAPARTVKK